MKTLKATLISFLMIATVSAAFAQRPMHRANKGNQVQQCQQMNPEEMAAKRTAMMKETLGLTDQQEKQVYALNLENARQHAVRMQAYEKMRNEGRQAWETQMAANDAQMKKILTDQQYQTWQQRQMQRKDNMKKKHHRMMQQRSNACSCVNKECCNK